MPKNRCPVSGDPKIYPKALESLMSWAINDILWTGWWYRQSCVRIDRNNAFTNVLINHVTRYVYIIIYVNNFATHPGLLVPQAKPVYADLNGDSLLVLAGGANRHLQVSQGRLAHPVTACFRYLQNTDQLCLERHALPKKAGWVVLDWKALTIIEFNILCETHLWRLCIRFKYKIFFSGFHVACSESSSRK